MIYVLAVFIVYQNKYIFTGNICVLICFLFVNISGPLHVLEDWKSRALCLAVYRTTNSLCHWKEPKQNQSKYFTANHFLLTLLHGMIIQTHFVGGQWHCLSPSHSFSSFSSACIFFFFFIFTHFIFSGWNCSDANLLCKQDSWWYSSQAKKRCARRKKRCTHNACEDELRYHLCTGIHCQASELLFFQNFESLNGYNVKQKDIFREVLKEYVI